MFASWNLKTSGPAGIAENKGGQEMSSENRLLRGSILTFLLVLCVEPEVLGHAPRFRGLKEFLPYTRNLPRIDKIELLKLKLKDDRWNGEIVASKVLKGAPAQKVASLWRRQTYTSSLSACHDPAYAIKFLFPGKVDRIRKRLLVL
jgi:hypothetical protein